eukprot:CAMPEP_0113501394 /NCGR_PEP_ID=MMETSP0014_2-20120614/32930_1 /TAXON_ID=2857 /ORGANISM="Nitzschia sp." /LENGTH=119 /DNA_ID=CAMNT_0000395977 /DNA_START=1116 /DNA_END=1471 /DNA_ORIENTATION=+ /assembly_acc=CAM_ASM_000159
MTDGSITTSDVDGSTSVKLLTVKGLSIPPLILPATLTGTVTFDTTSRSCPIRRMDSRDCDTHCPQRALAPEKESYDSSISISSSSGSSSSSSSISSSSDSVYPSTEVFVLNVVAATDEG